MSPPIPSDTVASTLTTDDPSHSPRKRKSKANHVASPSWSTSSSRAESISTISSSSSPSTTKSSSRSTSRTSVRHNQVLLDSDDSFGEEEEGSVQDDDHTTSEALSHKSRRRNSRTELGSKRKRIGSITQTIPVRALHNDFDEDTESSLEEDDDDSDHSLYEDDNNDQGQRDNHSPFDDDEESDVEFEIDSAEDTEEDNDEYKDVLVQTDRSQRTPAAKGSNNSKGTNRKQPPASKVNKPYECVYPGCDKAYTKPSRLEEHERSHTGERPYVCQEPGCKAAFRRESHFAVHMLGHSTVRAFACPEPGCEKSFYTEDKLIRHLKVHEDSIVARFPESDHAEEIIKRKPYACSWEGCFQRFAKHQKLKAHVCMVHEGRKPYPCPQEGCEMSFQTPSKLRKHQLVHSGEKRYACGAEGCGAYFSKWSQLQQHNKTSHKSMPCSTCGKMVLKRNITAHMKIHDSSRTRVPCSHEGCTKVFSTERTLATHVKTAHAQKAESEEGRFKCEYEDCLKNFEYKHVLERHVKRIHINPTLRRKKRSDALDSSLVDSLLGFSKEDVRAKLPFACQVPGCQARYSRQQLLDRHLASLAHQDVDSLAFLEEMGDLEEASARYEDEEIRNTIDMNF
ncbi:hypothetical protein BGZ83_003782 [Gryganskiella cystojenkinii]|nr:hypothetical protein BGZ83_003782 [Gryganskiella cystojenkinii]